MSIKLTGWEIKREEDALSTDDKEEKGLLSFTEKQNDDGSIVIETSSQAALGGGYSVFLDLEGSAKDEGALVARYREMAGYPELRRAIDDIVNEAIVVDEEVPVVTMNTDDIKGGYSEKITKRIREEFDEVLKLLDFSNKSYELFQKWYVDGRIYFHVLIDKENPQDGIHELRQVDPMKIRKVREVRTKKDPNTNAAVKAEKHEYFVYDEKGFGSVKQKKQNVSNQDQMVYEAVKIAKDAIVHSTSGVINADNTLILSHLHKAIKPLNQLRILEDSTVIYRVSRAPERLAFYIDVGDLPKAKAEQYLREQMTSMKNKLEYNSATGEIADSRRHMSMTENYWFPRRSDGKATEVQPIQGGQNLGEIEDVLYFQRKMYQSLDVPTSRLESDATFNFGRNSEITRDEIKFSKFIKRLRTRFSEIFDDLLEKQLVLKKVVSWEEWQEIKNDIKYVYAQDNHFEELKSIDVLRERVSLANEYEPLVGKYVSSMWVRKNILRQTDEDIEEIDSEIEEFDQDEFGDEEDDGGFAQDNDMFEPEPQPQLQNKTDSEDPSPKPEKKEPGPTVKPTNN